MVCALMIQNFGVRVGVLCSCQRVDHLREDRLLPVIVRVTPLAVAVAWDDRTIVVALVTDAMTAVDGIPMPLTLLPTSADVNAAVALVTVVELFSTPSATVRECLITVPACGISPVMFAPALPCSSAASTCFLIRFTNVGLKSAEPVRGDPKTARSRRVIEMPALAVEALRRRRQGTKVIALNGLVFTRSDGRSLAVPTVYSSWHQLLERAGVPKVRPHDARHTCATLMLGQGVHPKLVSEMLGHATVAITWNSTATRRRRCTARPRAPSTRCSERP